MAPLPDAPVRVVALDAMGVLYRQQGISAHLVALAGSRGVTVSETLARDAYRRASRGLLGAPELWQALGVPGTEAGELDEELLAGRTLSPGAREFLASMRAGGISVGCITNDVAAWSVRSRMHHGLDAGVAPWIVSAEVGVRKPGKEIYQAFLSASGCAAASCLFVDDQVENLDAARDLGFRTAWFASPAAASGHPRVGSFDELTAFVYEQDHRISQGGR